MKCWDETNQRHWVKAAVGNLILQCQDWVRIPWLPRMVTAVTALPAPTDVSPATGGEASPGRGHQDGKMHLQKWNLMEFWLRSAEQTYLSRWPAFSSGPLKFYEFQTTSKAANEHSGHGFDFTHTIFYPSIFLTHIILKLFSVTFIILSFIRISLLGMKR